MTTAHTAGPWEIDTNTLPVEICTIHRVPPQGDDKQRWVYVRGALGDWEATEETNMANARLIAASPTMYEFIAHKAEAGDAEAALILKAIHA